MNTLRYLLKKEFKQIFRNKALLPLIFVMPVIQLLILPLAADFEIKNINLAIIDHDHSAYAQQLVQQITASGYFKLVHYGNTYSEAFNQVEKNVADVLLEIPANFERNLVREQKQTLYLAVNAINGTKAILGGNYLSNIISNFNRSLQAELLPSNKANLAPVLTATASYWFNPLLDYQTFMVPGILTILVTMVGGYMCALNIVKEKEVGTIEQINVTPIKKHHYILGKLIPFWLIGLFVFTIGFFGVARFVYGILPLGSIGLLYAFVGLYLVALLGFGLLISTYSETEQQAMSLAFFFMMIFILMSGLFTTIDAMPEWAKLITWFNPVTYFIEVMRMVVLKGSHFQDIQKHFLVMFGFAVFFNTWAVLNYRKTS